MIEGMLSALREAFVWCVGVMLDIALTLFGPLLEWLGDAVETSFGVKVSTAFGVVAEYVAIVNAWVPLAYSGFLFGTWLTLRIIGMTARHVKKFIPLISG